MLDKASEQGKGRGSQLEVVYCIICHITSFSKSSLYQAGTSLIIGSALFGDLNQWS